MAYIYNADVYCDDCGNEIIRDLAVLYHNGDLGDVLPDGETSKGFNDVQDCADYLYSMLGCEYDSDDYPKHCDDESESDSPQHCGSGPDCLDAHVFADGSKCGCLIGSNLTGDGIEYVKEAVREGVPAAELWREHYDWIDFNDEE